MVSAPDNVKDASDGEESGIPALFTYFGQFIDHDLTFDPASSLQRQNDPDALVDFRTPAFDLDNVYGRGLDDQPYLYEADHSFALGHPMTGETGDAARSPIVGAHDLPRATASHRAIIGDPRNDENVILSQFHGPLPPVPQPPGRGRRVVPRGPAAHALALPMGRDPRLPPEDRCGADVLAKILPHVAAGTDVVADPPQAPVPGAPQQRLHAAGVLRRGLPVRPLDGPSGLPAETTRSSSRSSPSPGPTFPASRIRRGSSASARSRPTGRSTGPASSTSIPARRGATRPRAARTTRGACSSPTGSIARSSGRSGGFPSPWSTIPDPIKSLARRNLVRGWRMRLPSGQAVARAIGATPMLDEDILIGKAAVGETPFPILEQQGRGGQPRLPPVRGQLPALDLRAGRGGVRGPFEAREPDGPGRRGHAPDRHPRSSAPSGARSSRRRSAGSC